MWDGWFTKYWTPILQDMIKRKRTNTTQSHAYEIARKAAYKIRITIKQNLYEIWKIRSQIKHEPNEKKTWTKEQVQDMIHKLNRKLGRNVLWTAEELMKRRKRKLTETKTEHYHVLPRTAEKKTKGRNSRHEAARNRTETKGRNSRHETARNRTEREWKQTGQKKEKRSRIKKFIQRETLL